MLSKMLTRSQMALLCLGLFLTLALCGAWQAFAWGHTQLDTGALVCADTLRLHIRLRAIPLPARAQSSMCGMPCLPIWTPPARHRASRKRLPGGAASI